MPRYLAIDLSIPLTLQVVLETIVGRKVGHTLRLINFVCLNVRRVSLARDPLQYWYLRWFSLRYDRGACLWLAHTAVTRAFGQLVSIIERRIDSLLLLCWCRSLNLLLL